MAFVKTNPAANPGMINNPKPGVEPGIEVEEEDPKVKREQERLLKQKKQLDKKLEKLKKKSTLSNKIREIAFILNKTAQLDPNDDPQELSNQISDVLSDLGIKNIIERNKTQIFMDQQNAKKEYLYKVLLRRNDEIESDIVGDLDQESKNFERLKWTSKGNEVYLWGPYTLSVTEEKETPEIPGPVV